MCPRKPRRPCSYRGCAALTEERFCEKHKKEMDSEYNKRSRPFKYMYSTNRWRTLRKQFLKKHPLCKYCKDKGTLRGATVVDHIVAHKGNEELFWNESNWQALCKECHDRKTVKVDGRFGSKNVVYSYYKR